MPSFSRNSLKIFLFIFFLFPSVARAAITVLNDANTAVGIVATNQASLTIPSTTAGNFVAVVCMNSSNSSLVNITGVSDSAGDVFTLAPNSTSTSAANNNATMAIYYTNSVSAAQTTITCNFSQTGSYNSEIWEWEFSGVTSPHYDIGGAVNSGTAAGTTATGPTLLTTGTTEWGVAGAAIVGSINSNPKAGNTWTSGGGAGMIAAFGDAATGLIATSPGSTAPVWKSSISGEPYNSSAATWYVSVATSSVFGGQATIGGNSIIN
jgi:hypothetical protein